MKKFRLILILILPLFFFSCKKDTGPYIQIKNIENLIYQEIRDFRVAEGEDGPFVHQYFVVGEAQIYSYKMANGVVEVNTDGLDVHWDALLDKYSFYNLNALVLKTTSHDEDVILDELLLQTDGEATLLEDLTQCGVGVESDTEGNLYITVMLAKADS
ncbi:MAG: hypothetical protein DRI97_01195 [Bacteroidetes bacterium]|nr:MAG: hypothetical protein DRI97_01195 [Bacteroidota bacterium]RLD94556.1 MAG: hypothetical protein DRJ29_05580 [Bacteroidota bacterium]